ncbi:MAG: lipid-A-disaccharide synthase, partial [Motiliproteus sp.]
MRIALVAGEASGDIIGAGLIKALKNRHPDIQFEGIGGPLMIEQGMESFFPMERLSVMGLVEVLGRFRELLGIRNQLRDRWLANPPDILIGIDAPDFNLSLERQLKEQGIATCHYVSPSVWAWREGRVKKIARSTDLMLCLLPFEKAFYDRHKVDARFIGHPLADEIPLETDTATARQQLGLDLDDTWVAMLPGSRGGEVERLAPLFLKAARWLLQRQPQLNFLIPAANDERYQQLKEMLDGQQLPVQLVMGQSRTVMQASDAVLMASGTASLEGMLLKKPMVVAYRLAPLTYAIASRMLKIAYMSLPNLLANEPLVP